MKFSFCLVTWFSGTMPLCWLFPIYWLRQTNVCSRIPIFSQFCSLFCPLFLIPKTSYAFWCSQKLFVTTSLFSPVVSTPKARFATELKIPIYPLFPASTDKYSSAFHLNCFFVDDCKVSFRELQSQRNKNGEI